MSTVGVAAVPPMVMRLVVPVTPVTEPVPAPLETEESCPLESMTTVWGLEPARVAPRMPAM